MSDLLIRGLVGGAIVSVFAMLGDALKPKSFSGLFGAAPSVALTSLALGYRSRGAPYIATEAGWMVAGTAAFAVYAWIVCRVLVTGRHSVRLVASASLAAWLMIALSIWGTISGACQP